MNRHANREAHVVVGLGYGDEGKGTIVDHLVRERGATQIVRFNGGAQAAHNVVTDDGRHHTFAQLGAASFVPGVRTHLSRFVLVNPLLLFLEAEQLEREGGPADVLARLSIHAGAALTTPFHVAANRARRTAKAQGSCGLGIGETMRDVLAGRALHAGDLRDPIRLYRLLEDAQRRWAPWSGRDELRDAFDVFAALPEAVDIVDETILDDVVVFEGAQGVLLDERHGAFPHVTFSTTTDRNARIVLEEAGWTDTIRTIGVIRSYMTRHGAGPFATEDPAMRREERHNAYGEFQGAWRVGHPDLVALRYAVNCCDGVDALAVTHVDMPPEQVAVAYREGPVYEPCEDIVAAYEMAAGVEAEILSAGPRPSDKRVTVPV